MRIKLNFKVKGSGKPIIILHGLFGMLDNWNSISNTLAENFSVYTVDQRDHGRSDKSTEFGYESIAEDLKYFCDENDLKEIGIIGHSMGGKSAMTFADRFPEYVKKLMVIDISPKTYDGGHEFILEAILSIPIDTVTSRQEVDELLSRQIKILGIRQFLMKNLSRKNEGGFEWKANFPLLNKHYPDILGMPELRHGNDLETLFISGGKSDYIMPEDHKVIKELYPRARIEIIENAGHWVHAEQPNAIIDKINAFFQ